MMPSGDLGIQLGDDRPTWMNDADDERGTPEPSEGRCNARLRGGGYCPNYPIAGRNRCKWHGGKALRGAAHPRYKHGKYSKYPALPERYAAAYEETLRNPDYISLRDEIAMIDARLAELVGALDEGGLSALWDEITAVAQAVRNPRNQTEAQAATAHLLALVDRAADEARQWDTLIATIERKARLVDTERKHVNTVHPNQVMTFVFAVLDAVKESFAKYIDAEHARAQALQDMEDRLTHLAGESGAIVIEQRKADE